MGCADGLSTKLSPRNGSMVPDGNGFLRLDCHEKVSDLQPPGQFQTPTIAALES